jgi:hypothetical protein
MNMLSQVAMSAARTHFLQSVVSKKLKIYEKYLLTADALWIGNRIY